MHSGDKPRGREIKVEEAETPKLRKKVKDKVLMQLIN